MSFYLTYRPKKIAELDLSSVRDTLLASLVSGSISHAYLFVGPRGSGKTSTARIMAQIINCKENLGKKDYFSEPCGECEACQVITRGSSVDVIEIDAASNGLVDDIRELRDRVRLSPVQLVKKVYIIDEVHMVSTAGFNALLKTLEEPPVHALFILCTTEPQKIPETIISRCSRVNFTKATMDEVVRSLSKAVLGEGLSVEDDVLQEVAEATDGSFREGHKLLEQLTSFGKKIDRSILSKVLGVAGRHSIKKLLEAAINGENEIVMQTFDEMDKAGTKATILASSLLEIAKAEMEKAVREAKSYERYLELIEKLIDASDKIKVSPLPLLPLEIALLSTSLGAGKNPRPKVQVPAQDKETPRDTVITASVETLVDRDKEIIQSKEVPQVFSDNTINIDAVKTGWVDFLNCMAEKNGSLAGMLRLVSPVHVDGKSLTISVTSRFQQEMLERDVKKKVIEEQMAKVWGPMTFKCVLTDKVIRTEPEKEDENISQVTGGVDTIQGVMSAAEKIFGN